MVRSLPIERYENLVTLYPYSRSHPLSDLAGLTIEEAIEFVALDALPPFERQHCLGLRRRTYFRA
jgi:hypothetical protein